MEMIMGAENREKAQAEIFPFIISAMDRKMQAAYLFFFLKAVWNLPKQQILYKRPNCITRMLTVFK